MSRTTKRWRRSITVTMALTFDGQGAEMEPAELAEQIAAFLGQPDGYGLIFSTQRNGERVGTAWVIQARSTEEAP